VDTPDVANYAADVRAVMPDIDAITMATPPADVSQLILFTAPDDWADGDYVAWMEVNVEGDYNATFNDTSYPTPTMPAGEWDSWAMDYGYPYRGQPSVVYEVPFTLGAPGSFGVAEPAGYGDVDGFGPTGGDLHPFMASVITDSPSDATMQGSGADRLRLTSASPDRLQVVVRDPKECETDVAPGVPAGVTAGPVPDSKHAHEWGHLRFLVPQSNEPVAHYEVRYDKNEITADDPSTFDQAMPALAAMIDTQALMVPTSSGPGSEVEVDFGGMEPLTRYWVAIRAVDICNVPGPYAVASLTTTRVQYTQLKGCFVATAAYGSALEPQVQVLREARDAVRPHSVLAATAIDLYYRSGPAAAAVLEKSDLARAVARTVLGPIIELARAATAEPAPAP
jgi:hypothetical protein